MIGLPLLRSASQLRSRIKSWRAFGESTALVPIVGRPHAGYAHVIRDATREADRVLAALIPPEPASGELPDDGPSPFEPDAVALADEAGADALYVPSPAVFRPQGMVSRISVRGLSEVLDGEDRPGAFDVFCADIVRLLAQSQPEITMFCACEWQRMTITKRIAADFDLCAGVVACEQERTTEGAACVENVFEADEAGVDAAARLWRALSRAAAQIEGGQDADGALDAAADALADQGAEVEYLDLRDEATLDELEAADPARPSRVFGAIQTAASVRLTDNVPLGGR